MFLHMSVILSTRGSLYDVVTSCLPARGGLCPGDSVQGFLSKEVSVRGVFVRKTPLDREPLSLYSKE